MNITGTTFVTVETRGTLHGTRVCGKFFNEALREVRHGKRDVLIVKDETGAVITPSKGLNWEDVAKQIRAGKSVQASIEGKKKGGPRAKRVAPSAETLSPEAHV